MFIFSCSSIVYAIYNTTSSFVKSTQKNCFAIFQKYISQIEVSGITTSSRCSK